MFRLNYKTLSSTFAELNADRGHPNPDYLYNTAEVCVFRDISSPETTSFLYGRIIVTKLIQHFESMLLKLKKYDI